MAELLHETNDRQLLDNVLAYLETVKTGRPKTAHLIDDGLELIFEKENVN
jgi:phenylalanine-4-hydroxylase